MNKLIKKYIGDISALGSLPFYLFIFAFMFILGNTILSYRLFLALIISYTITILIRSVYYKRRPNKERYKTALEKIDSSSFPSLHSMRAVVLLILLGANYSNLLLTSLLSLMALGIFYSRYYLKKHYISDIIAGAIIGAIIALLIPLII